MQRQQGLCSTLMVLLAAGSLAACLGDPSDPQTWIKKLDGAERGQAIDKLVKLYETAGERTQKGLAVRNAAVPALAAAYEKDDKRLELLEALKKFEDRRADPVMRKALDFIPGVNETHARIAAEVLGEHKDKEAAGLIMKGLAKISGSGPDPTTTRRIFIIALGKIGDPKAIPTLTEIAGQQLSMDSIKPIAAAASALGELRHADAVPVLVHLALTTAPPISNIAAVALCKIGAPAAELLEKVLKGEAPEVVKKAEGQKGFNTEDLLPASAATLGWVGEKSSVPALVARLTEKDTLGVKIRATAAPALGIIGDPAAVEPLAAVLETSGYFDDEERIAFALGMLGDKKALPALFKAMKMGFVKDGDGKRVAHALRWQAAAALSRMIGDEEAGQYEALAEAEKDAETKKFFDEQKPRIAAAKECKSDVGCWQKKLKDKDWMVQERAFYALAHIGDKKAVDSVLAELGTRDEKVRLAVILALDRLADKSCAQCIPKLTAQIDSDRTDSKFKSVIVYEEAALLERIRRR
jgi:HEAT repeat protein